ncbi:MAG: proline--tRNA ligase [Acidimicrobiia bacterium]
MAALAKRSEDFPRWYQDVITHAELAEGGPARGTIVIRPYGYGIWEQIQRQLDERIKETGHENAYFPLFIPLSFLEKEAEHVEGFSPELAVVTHGGGKELGEPLVVRPTSETVINYMFSKWIQSHRDLPVLVNQWANVVRWELRPRLFLRTTEFLWQEGHTAHATSDEAREEALRMLGVYREFIRSRLAISAITGEKTPKERFAGADKTYTLEGLMQDGKALQMGTSHELGQNFARAFDIVYTAEDGSRHHVWQTSWGVSTRLIGAVIMAHGDDFGLRLPPAIAPVQVVVVPLASEDPRPTEVAHQIAHSLMDRGIRVKVDTELHQSFGWRSVAWEIKGVPVRVEVGPRDLASSSVMLVRRDKREKLRAPLDRLEDTVETLLREAQDALFKESDKFRKEKTYIPNSFNNFLEAIQENPGFYVMPICGERRCEDRLADEASASVRCIDSPELSEAGYDNKIAGILNQRRGYCLLCGDEAAYTAVVAKAY